MTKQLSERFGRSVYRSSYQTIPAKVIENGKNIYELLSASFIDANDANNEAGIKDNKSIIFREERLKAIMYWLMEETFMIDLLMT